MGRRFALIVVAEGATIAGEGVGTKTVEGTTLGGRHAPILGGAGAAGGGGAWRRT
jgi:hypothetical protein